jgi:hypothetical protein
MIPEIEPVVSWSREQDGPGTARKCLTHARRRLAPSKVGVFCVFRISSPQKNYDTQKRDSDEFSCRILEH